MVCLLSFLRRIIALIFAIKFKLKLMGVCHAFEFQFILIPVLGCAEDTRIVLNTLWNS